MREPAMCIISIAQQARPNWAGQTELPRPQPTTLPMVVVMRLSPRTSPRSSKPMDGIPAQRFVDPGGSDPRSRRAREGARWYARPNARRRRRRRWVAWAPKLPWGIPSVGLVPFEATFAPDVGQCDQEDGHEDQHLDQAVPAQLAEDHRPGIEEDGLD